MNELISVVIPTFGRAKYLQKSIDSILNQTYHNVEIIVVDDNGEGKNSRRETESFMRQYNGNKDISYIKLHHNP